MAQGPVPLNVRSALVTLLQKLYPSQRELRIWLRQVDYLEADLEAWAQRDYPQAHVHDRLVGELLNLALVNRKLFEGLLRDHPGDRAQIRAVATAWNVDLTESSGVTPRVVFDLDEEFLPIAVMESEFAHARADRPALTPPRDSRETDSGPAAPAASAAPFRVFLSYSHDSPAHDQAVRDLANRLRADGIDASIDQYVAAPPEGWPRWMQRQVEESRFVVLVCTETYKRRFEGREKPDAGKGATWEGLLAQQILYDAGTINEKLIPVLLDGASDDLLPLALKPYTHYRLPAGYDALYRHLTGQPAVVAPPLGKVRAMPPVARGPALPPQPVVSPGLPAAPPAGTQTITNHGPVGQQINVQGGSHVFNLGKGND